MSRPRRKNRIGKWSAPIIIILLVMIGGGLLFIHAWEQKELEREALLASENDVYVPHDLILSYEGQDYSLRDGIETFLLIGLDKVTNTLSDPESYVNNQQGDFLFLMIVDHNRHTFSALHINRDTMAEINRYGLGGARLKPFTAQLALAHTYGSGGRDSCQHTVEAVSKFLYGLPINHFASITMDAIPVLNDLVGGVVVHVEDDFSTVDPSIKMGENVRLKGKQALTFVRARMSMAEPTNIRRMARQREYLNGLYTQLGDKLKMVDGFAMRMASKLADFMVSDLSPEQVSTLAERLKDYNFTTIHTIEGEAVMGEQYIEFYADQDALLRQVLQLFFEPVPQN